MCPISSPTGIAQKERGDVMGGIHATARTLLYYWQVSEQERRAQTDHKIILKSVQSKHLCALTWQITIFSGFLWSSMTEP